VNESRNAVHQRIIKTETIPFGYRAARFTVFDLTRVLGIAQDVPNDEGRHIRLVGQPFTLSRTPSKMAARPPEFGQQTDEVLTEFGFTKDEIASLRQNKVV
jgi:crotonobetainyl-CoA:carnitine CoA-transferase CaiB-like acyl-CoA transferase